MRDSNEIVVGGLYASKNDDGSFGVSKVLAVDATVVQIRIYRNRFPSIPRDIDPSVSTLRGIGDPEGFGIGHAPVAKQGWLVSQVFLKKPPLTDEELEGYKYCLEEMQKR